MSKNIMIRTLWLLLVIITVGLRAYAQEGTSQVRYNKTTHNFGKIKETNGEVSCVFEFTNTSKKPFIMDFVSVSCGCTTPEYSKAPIMPGGKGKIKVSFDPSGRPGTFNKSIIVTSNNRQDQVILSIVGDVIGKPRSVEDDFPVILPLGLRATSSSFLFGYLARGKKMTQAIDLYNSSDVILNLGTKIVSGEKNFVSIKALPSTLKPKQRGRMEFTYDFSNADLWGLISTQFVVLANGKVLSGDFIAYATVTEDFSMLTEAQKKSVPRGDFSTQFYHFGDVKRGETISHEFIITNTGTSPLVFRSIKPNSSSISYTIDKKVLSKGMSATLKATIKPTAEGRVSESITVILNDPARPMREIRLAAVVN